MDALRKAIQNLTVSLDEKREELNGFYRQFGAKMLNDSSDPTVLGGALSNERVDGWRTVMSAREADNQAILGIKDAIRREQELLSFKKELESTLHDEKARLTRLLEDLGRSFYGYYTKNDVRVFGETYDKATVEGNTLITLEEKQDVLQKQLLESGFFGKIVTQLRMAGLSSSIRQQKTRVMRIFSDGAEKLLSDGSLESRILEGEFDNQFAKTYTDVKESRTALTEIKKRADSHEADLGAIADVLTGFGAGSNPFKRMDALRFAVKEADKRIDSLILLSAREYSDKFLDEDGLSLLGDTGDGHTFSDMGTYAYQLEQIALLRSEISVIRRKIELLETAFKIEAIEKIIVAHEHTIAENERKIKNFQAMSETLKKNIAESNEEKTRLAERKETIEKTLPSVSS